MRSILATAAFVLFSAAYPACADLVWNNYQGPSGYDHLNGLSSERQTLVTESWTADDAIISAVDYPLGVFIQEIRWIGLRDPGYPSEPIEYPTADFIILTDTFSVVREIWNLPYTATVIGSDFDLETYEGAVAVPDVQLSPGRYYFAARITDDFIGRNFLATSGAGTIRGTTAGYFKSAYFGYSNWTPVAPIQGSTDYAYQVYGIAVPEPHSLLVVVLGGVLVLLRRR